MTDRRRDLRLGGAPPAREGTPRDASKGRPWQTKNGPVINKSGFNWIGILLLAGIGGTAGVVSWSVDSTKASALEIVSAGRPPAATAAAPARTSAQDAPIVEIAEAAAWEKFLREAEITGQERISGEQAVTSPWRLTLALGGVERYGLWKNPEGRLGGFIEGWQYEIAAYLLDRHLRLNMVPPTVERRFQGERGSLQIWIDGCMTALEKEEKKLRIPGSRLLDWNRATYLQRAFDNLIGNYDRHLNQVLVTPDWHLILIDHSRAFAASKFDKRLIYTEKHHEGPKLMRQLPKGFVERLKTLDFETIRAATGGCLNPSEIRNMLVRRDLITAEIDRLIGLYGADGPEGVLY